jgi:dienelactone hydrolase
MAEAEDAYAALHYLAAQDFVDPERVVVMGYGGGGSATLMAIERGRPEAKQQEHFRAAVTYYPSCRFSTGKVTAPLLILIGERDDWASVDDCRKLAAQKSDVSTAQSGATPEMRLVIYPVATLGFDDPDGPRDFSGHHMVYDVATANQAEAHVRAFLDDALRH